MTDLINQIPDILNWISANWSDAGLYGLLIAALVGLMAAPRDFTTQVGYYLGKAMIRFSGKSMTSIVDRVQHRIIPYTERIYRTVDWVADGVWKAYVENGAESKFATPKVDRRINNRAETNAKTDSTHQ